MEVENKIDDYLIFICWIIHSITPLFRFSKFKGILFVIVPYLIFSLCVMLNTQLTHNNHYCTKHYSKDWYRHQILTSSNFSTNNIFVTIFSGYLNYQIEHHLFPYVNHCHLPKIHTIVKKISTKYNIQYYEAKNYLIAIDNYYKYIYSISIKK